MVNIMSNKQNNSKDQGQNIGETLIPENAIKDLHEDKKTRGYIESFLVIQCDMTPKDAKVLVQNVLGKNKTGSANWGPTITFIRENLTMDKKDLIQGMMEKKEAKESSMNHAYNYIKFAQEYARQEVEAFVKAQEETQEEA